MASTAPTPSRRSLLGAIAAVPLVAAPALASSANCDAWDAAYADYRRKDALWRACDSFGHGVDSDERHARLRMKLTGAMGAEPDKRTPAEAEASELRAEYDRSVRVNELEYATYAEPANAAAITLVLTPAPHLNAVDAKIAAVTAYDLNNDNRFPGHPFDVIEADVRRLAGAR